MANIPTSIPATITPIALSVVLLIAARTIPPVLLRRVLFETLILLLYIDQQVFAELLGVLDLVGIRTAKMCQPKVPQEWQWQAGLTLRAGTWLRRFLDHCCVP